MDIIGNIVRYFEKKQDNHKNTSPQGTCPVCWGYQQYDGKIRDLFKDRQIDVNNHKDNYTTIQNFMKYKIEGVKLKEGKIIDCPNCSDKK